MLTGKFKKGDTEPPKGSRMELGTKLKTPLDNFPDIGKFLKDEKYWALRDAMQKMADRQGILWSRNEVNQESEQWIESVELSCHVFFSEICF